MRSFFFVQCSLRNWLLFKINNAICIEIIVIECFTVILDFLWTPPPGLPLFSLSRLISHMPRTSLQKYLPPFLFFSCSFPLISFIFTCHTNFQMIKHTHITSQLQSFSHLNPLLPSLNQIYSILQYYIPSSSALRILFVSLCCSLSLNLLSLAWWWVWLFFSPGFTCTMNI